MDRSCLSERLSMLVPIYLNLVHAQICSGIFSVPPPAMLLMPLCSRGILRIRIFFLPYGSLRCIYSQVTQIFRRLREEFLRYTPRRNKKNIPILSFCRYFHGFVSHSCCLTLEYHSLLPLYGRVLAIVSILLLYRLFASISR